MVESVLTIEKFEMIKNFVINLKLSRIGKKRWIFFLAAQKEVMNL